MDEQVACAGPHPLYNAPIGAVCPSSQQVLSSAVYYTLEVEIIAPNKTSQIAEISNLIISGDDRTLITNL
ncbi:hypothetical protein CRV24_007569 [Beauveria bassiana]|nr:hypothetical protein CRV24_007569 [Beauveria bassiana]KAH8715602.1 hypothetical protein HC256_004405 [Beauveria bassiana]